MTRRERRGNTTGAMRTASQRELMALGSELGWVEPASVPPDPAQLDALRGAVAALDAELWRLGRRCQALREQGEDAEARTAEADFRARLASYERACDALPPGTRP